MMPDHRTVRDRLEQVMSSKWFTASPVSWITLTITMVGLIYNFGVSHANLNAQLAANTFQIQRNRDDANERFKSIETNVASLHVSMSAIHAIKTEIEVIKTILGGIKNELERYDRNGRSRQQKSN